MFTRLSSRAGRRTLTTAAHPLQKPAVNGPQGRTALLARGERACCCAARPTVIAVFAPNLADPGLSSCSSAVTLAFGLTYEDYVL